MPKGQITEISEWLLRDDIRLSTEDSPKASGKSASQVVQSFSVEGGPAPEVDFGTTNWVGRLTGTYFLMICHIDSNPLQNTDKPTLIQKTAST